MLIIIIQVHSKNIFLILTKTMQIYSLAIHVKYFLKKINSWWLGKNIYIMNNIFCYNTLIADLLRRTKKVIYSTITSVSAIN